MGLVTPVDPVPLTELGKVHFVGIGGAGMSGIARIMLGRGVQVSGSDSVDSPLLGELAAAGAQVHVGHAAANLGDADTLVVSTAIRADNPEVVQARRRGIRIVHRAGALASVMLGRDGIAVAGTHGKTTTTSMITTILRHCGADPSYVIGGILAETGLGAGEGTGHAFVVEADESDGSFLMLAPRAAVVTTVEADHLDNYGSLAEIEQAFGTFAGRIPAGGLLVTCADDQGASALAGRLSPGVQAISYGMSGAADYRVTSVRPAGLRTGLTLAGGPRTPLTGPVDVEIAVPGRHNALNAAAAFALTVQLGERLGVRPADAAAGLAAYRGARRRMELKGAVGGVQVIDSYAHHPTELAADLDAARDALAAGDNGAGRLIAVFQPHLFSRTRIFAAAFGAALDKADEVLVLDVYAAREDPEPGVSGRLVADAVPGGRASFLPDAAAVPAAVAALAKPGDMVLTMGAGDVTALGPRILAALSDRDSGPAAARAERAGER
jgi:UDP-N-acetylmuramate--alanine ligase